MTGLEDAAYTELVSLIQSAWPGLTAVRREEQLGRANWENLLAAGGLAAPFAVVRLGPSRPDAWGLDNQAFRFDVVVTVVVAVNDANAALSGGGADVAAYILQQLGVLRAALIAYSGAAFQLAGEHPAVDASTRSEANRILLSLLAGLQAGEINASLLVGLSP